MDVDDVTNNNFQDVRKKALKLWQEKTKRTPEDENSSAFIDAFECQWQQKHAGEFHNNFFCSLGEFATSIDDLLTDERLDDIEITNYETTDENESKLYRYYCRVLLVADQIIEDFQTEIKNQSDFPSTAKTLRGFVNSAIKHKTKKSLHFNKHNNHCRFYFEGELINPSSETEIISQDNLSYFCKNDTEKTVLGLLLPSLNNIVCAIIDCYEAFDKLLEDEEFKNRFNGKYCTINQED